jgi:hypothetical protein
MQNFISRLVRFFIKLVLAVFGLVFAISLLLAALIVVVVSLLLSLVTGRKPAPVMVFSKFQKFAPGGRWPGAGKAKNTHDVVDVDMREVQTQRQPPKSDQPPS